MLPLEDDGSKQRRPLMELLFLAAPTVAQMASYTVLQFVDTWMLARWQVLRALPNDVAATAAGNAGMFAFSIVSFGTGMLWLVNTLVSQHYGRGTWTECGRYLWQGIWFSLLYALILLPSIFIGPAVFRSFGHEPMLVELESQYYFIAVVWSAVKMVGVALGQFLLAVNRPVVVFLAAFTAVVINIPANYVLIYGKLGFPEMGVAGAAWGTNIAVTVEAIVLAIAVLGPMTRRRFSVLDWRPRWLEFKTLLRVGAPSGVQIVADVLAWSLYTMWVMALFGTVAMAANTYMMRYMVVSFMPAFGISAAVTALVGRYIGRGDLPAAARRAHLGFAVTGAYMMTCGLLFFIFRHDLIGLFTEDPKILQMGALLLTFAAIYQFFDAMYIVYNGALRGAGDTFVPAVVTGGLCWGMVLGGGYLAARFFPQLGIAGPWSIATLYGIILGLFMLIRFRAGGWRRIDLVRRHQADKVPDFEASISTHNPVLPGGEGSVPQP